MSATITRLDGASARKISAGQVITDITSVVKELLENALDAKATSVTVRVLNYGVDRVVVEDNGGGIRLGSIVDLSTGILLPGSTTPLLANRATTKQHEVKGGAKLDDGKEEDTDTAEDPSLGFRGEALHSLAHVGIVEVETMSEECQPYTLTIQYSKVQHCSNIMVSKCKTECGTTVTVEGLFEHLPVRLRELKKNCKRQLLKAVGVVKQYAISHPGVRLIMTHQESPASAISTLVSLTGSGSLMRSATEAYGGVSVSHMQFVTWTLSFGTFHGFVSKVSGGGRMNADHQVTSLDGRLVDLPRLAKAVNDAFTQCLPNASQRLSVAFFFQIKSAPSILYDVNLTPSKRKVLLMQEEVLAEELYRCALNEFSAASQEIELSRDARIAQTRAADIRASDMTKLNRTPVSATSFTQFTFKRAKVEGPEVPEPPSIELPKLGSLLYAEDLGDKAEVGEGLQLTSSTESALLVTSEDDDEGDAAASEAESELSVDMAGASWNDGKNEDNTGPPLVTRLSDEGGRQRKEACVCYRGRFPALSELRKESLFPHVKVEVSIQHQKRGRSTRTLGNQTESDLNQYFNKNSFKEMRVLGQFNHGFIVSILGNGDIFIIDQHASDEKYNYERLMRTYVARPQPLVIPVSISMGAQEIDLAIEHCEALLHHGFQVRRGADDTKLLVYSIPVLPYDVVNASDVMELIQQLVQYGSITKPLRSVWHSMATKACRSSIMIGTPLDVNKMRQILHRLSELDQPWNCPHGRPTLRLLCNLSELRPSP